MRNKLATILFLVITIIGASLMLSPVQAQVAQPHCCTGTVAGSTPTPGPQALLAFGGMGNVTVPCPTSSPGTTNNFGLCAGDPGATTNQALMWGYMTQTHTTGTSNQMITSCGSPGTRTSSQLADTSGNHCGFFVYLGPHYDCTTQVGNPYYYWWQDSINSIESGGLHNNTGGITSTNRYVPTGESGQCNANATGTGGTGTFIPNWGNATLAACMKTYVYTSNAPCDSNWIAGPWLQISAGEGIGLDEMWTESSNGQCVKTAEYGNTMSYAVPQNQATPGVGNVPCASAKETLYDALNPVPIIAKDVTGGADGCMTSTEPDLGGLATPTPPNCYPTDFNFSGMQINSRYNLDAFCASLVHTNYQGAQFELPVYRTVTNSPIISVILNTAYYQQAKNICPNKKFIIEEFHQDHWNEQMGFIDLMPAASSGIPTVAMPWRTVDGSGPDYYVDYEIVPQTPEQTLTTFSYGSTIPSNLVIDNGCPSSSNDQAPSWDATSTGGAIPITVWCGQQRMPVLCLQYQHIWSLGTDYGKGAVCVNTSSRNETVQSSWFGVGSPGNGDAASTYNYEVGVAQCDAPKGTMTLPISAGATVAAPPTGGTANSTTQINVSLSGVGFAVPIGTSITVSGQTRTVTAVSNSSPYSDNKQLLTLSSALSSIPANGTAVTGTPVAGHTITTTINGHAFTYTVTSGDASGGYSTLATNLASAINSDSVDGAIVTASASGTVITVKSKTTYSTNQYTWSITQTGTSEIFTLSDVYLVGIPCMGAYIPTSYSGSLLTALQGANTLCSTVHSVYCVPSTEVSTALQFSTTLFKPDSVADTCTNSFYTCLHAHSAAIYVQSSSSPPSSQPIYAYTGCGGTPIQIYNGSAGTPDSIMNKDISTASVDTNSANIMSLHGSVSLDSTNTSSLETVNCATSSTTTYAAVKTSGSSHPPIQCNTTESLGCAGALVPWATGFLFEGQYTGTPGNQCSGDCHWIVLNTSTHVDTEGGGQATNNLFSGGVLTLWAGEQLNLDDSFTNNWNNEAALSNATGDSGIPQLGTTLFKSDMATAIANNSHIYHPLNFILPVAAAICGYGTPAGCTNSSPFGQNISAGTPGADGHCITTPALNNCLWYGDLLRLKSTFTSTACSVSDSQITQILWTMQHMGGYVSDTGSLFQLRTGYDTVTEPALDSNFWACLGSMHLSDFEIVTRGTTKP